MANEASSTPYYCITQARCRLCQFALTDNELVVAAAGDGVSCEFPFQRHTTFHDDELDIKFHMCLKRECKPRTKPTVCFHGRCHEFRFYSVTPAFLAATNYAFSPPASEERRRADYIRQSLARNLQQVGVWPRELPPELWLLVAGLLVQECAGLTAQEQVHECEIIGDSVIDLAQPVFASYIKIDGRYYIKSLRNTAGANASKGTCLVLPARATRGREGEEEEAREDMFVAEDHLGIRQIVFVSPKRRDEWCRSLVSVPGVWWRHISLKAIPSAVAIKGDGFKIRDIESTQKEHLALLSRIGWQVPVPSPPTVIDLFTLERPRLYPNGLRMRFFDCNTPDIVGYSVATDGARVLAILSHKQDEKADATLYEDASAAICFWMYMPINRGEYLTDICRRAGRSVIGTNVVGITFSTNQARTVVFGLYGHEHVELRRIITLPRGPCRVYFNQLDSSAGIRNVGVVAFEHGGPRAATNTDMLPVLPVSISPCPYTQSNEVWLHSSCSLEHVIEVHPCIKRTAPHRPVTGMLIYYADGHRECVGQFRLDWVAKPVMIGETDRLYICDRRTRECWRYVAAVTARERAPASQVEGRWLDIAQAGTLEWWFSSRHSLLYHDGTRLN